MPQCLIFGMIVLLAEGTIGEGEERTTSRFVTLAVMQEGRPTADQSAVSIPVVPDGKAHVRVYRERRVFGAAVHPLVFVNDNLLAPLKNGMYAEVEVSDGPVRVSTTNIGIGKSEAGLLSRHEAFYQSKPTSAPALRWPDCELDPHKKKPTCSWDPSPRTTAAPKVGCSNLNWQNLRVSLREDVVTCISELRTTLGSLNYWINPGATGRQLLAGIVIPTSIGADVGGSAMTLPGKASVPWLQMCAVNALPDPSSAQAKVMRTLVRSEAKQGIVTTNYGRCRAEVVAAYEKLQGQDLNDIELGAVAGQTYYVKYSITLSGPKLVVVRAETGIKEIAHLQLAKLH